MRAYLCFGILGKSLADVRRPKRFTNNVGRQVSMERFDLSTKRYLLDKLLLVPLFMSS
jgi:hypothetical protein